MSYSERTIEKEERLYGYDTKEPLKRDEGLLGEEDRLKNLSLSGANQNVIVLHPVGEPSLLTTESRFEQPILERPIIEQPIMEQPIFEQPIFEQPIRERPLETATVYEQEYIRKPVLPAGEGALATEGAVGTSKLSKREKKKLLLTPEERAAKNAKLSKLTGAKREKALAKRRAKIEKREWKIRYLNEQIAILSGASTLGTSDYGYSGRSDVAGIGSTPSVGYSSGASSSYASGWSSTGVTGASDIGYAGETKPGLMTRLKQKFSRTKTPEDREAKLTRLRGLSGVERDEMLAKKRHKVNLAEEKVRYLREQIALLEERPLTTDVSSTGYTGYSSGYSSGLLTGAAVSSTACPHVQTGYEPCATCLPSTIQLTPMSGAPIVQPAATFATVTAVSPISRPAVTPVVAPVTPIAPATETGLVRDVEGSLATRDLLASETTATTETTHAGKYGGAHSIGEMLSTQRDFDTASRTDVGVVSPSGRVISSERGLSSDRVISPRSGAAGLAATEPVVAATTVPGLTGGAAPIAGMETAAEGRYGGAHSIREMLSKDKDFPALARQAEATGTVPATEHKPGFIERIADKLTGKHHRETAHP